MFGLTDEVGCHLCRHRGPVRQDGNLSGPSGYDSDYGVCFFDIDHFKLINDTYGHEAGDVVLAAIGKMLRKYSRQVDFVGRYGGEEFVILLPETTLADAIKFADKMREIVQNSKFISNSSSPAAVSRIDFWKNMC